MKKEQNKYRKCYYILPCYNVSFFFWHWHYLAKSCDTQMGTNKKRKKKTREQKWHGQENQVPLSCFAPPPYAYLVFPEKEKDL